MQLGAGQDNAQMGQWADQMITDAWSRWQDDKINAFEKGLDQPKAEKGEGRKSMNTKS